MEKYWKFSGKIRNFSGHFFRLTSLLLMFTDNNCQSAVSNLDTIYTYNILSRFNQLPQNPFLSFQFTYNLLYHFPHAEAMFFLALHLSLKISLDNNFYISYNEYSNANYFKFIDINMNNFNLYKIQLHIYCCRLVVVFRHVSPWILCK